jgi:hypothetical protein
MSDAHPGGEFPLLRNLLAYYKPRKLSRRRYDARVTDAEADRLGGQIALLRDIVERQETDCLSN